MKQDETTRILQSYLAGLRVCINEIDQQGISEVAGMIYQAYLKGNQVFIFGNGGSALTASHFAHSLFSVSDKPRIKAIRISDNLGAITSIANDKNYESIFSEQLVGQIQKGDIALAMSCSGNSPNVLKALTYARENQAKTIGFTGFDGGRLGEMVDLCVKIHSLDKGQVEDMHLALGHIISKMLSGMINDRH